MTTRSKQQAAWRIAAVAALFALIAAPVLATNGYLIHGIGTRAKALAGAGAAYPQDALAAATNPAGMAFVGKRYDFGLGIFNPGRQYTVSGNPSFAPGTFGLAPGTVESDSDYFFVPNFGAAWQRAGFSAITDLDGLETHDCFTVTEYMAIDHAGLTAPGESWKAVEDGRIAADGDFPINPSGGLIGLGHPVGATGVRMLLDCARQVSGTAGDYQLATAENMITFNVGGSTTTCASFVVGVGA